MKKEKTHKEISAKGGRNNWAKILETMTTAEISEMMSKRKKGKTKVIHRVELQSK